MRICVVCLWIIFAAYFSQILFWGLFFLLACGKNFRRHTRKILIFLCKLYSEKIKKTLNHKRFISDLRAKKFFSLNYTRINKGNLCRNRSEEDFTFMLNAEFSRIQLKFLDFLGELSIIIIRA